MQALPSEIIRRILRHATIVRGASDTGIPHAPEDEHSEISRSMATKLALSLVSKLFHDLTDEYLFEIIRVTDDQTSRPLAVLLREVIPGKPSRGWWCRRLEVDLRYPGRSWQWGAFALWGLIPACPRLADLRCHVEYLNQTWGSHGATDLEARFPVSDVMLKLIASDLGRTLRRLELTGQVTATFPTVERLLLHLDQLESCHILGLQYDDPSDPFRISDNANDQVSREMPDYGDEPFAACQDAQEREEYSLMRIQASWPTHHDGTQVPTPPALPRLQTLHLSHFTSAICKWNMPSLVEIGAGFPYWFGTPQERAEEVKKAVSDSITNIARLTCYVSQSQGIDIWSLVGSLPSIEVVEYHVPSEDLESNLSTPLAHLHLLTIYRNKYNNPGHNIFLQKVHDYRRDGLLPALKQIYVTGSKVRSGQLAAALVQEFTAMGVSVESDVTKPLWVVDNV